MVQWLRIRLAMQGSLVRSLGRSHPHTLEPVLHNRSHYSENLCPATTESGLHSPRLEKARVQQRRPTAAKKTFF